MRTLEKGLKKLTAVGCPPRPTAGLFGLTPTEDRSAPAQRQEQRPGLGMEPIVLLTLTRAVLGQVFIFALLLLPKGAAARRLALSGLGDARHAPAETGGHRRGPAATPAWGTAAGLLL